MYSGKVCCRMETLLKFECSALPSDIYGMDLLICCRSYKTTVLCSSYLTQLVIAAYLVFLPALIICVITQSCFSYLLFPFCTNIMLLEVVAIQLKFVAIVTS